MAITRLQQARQMFRYGGDTMGGPNDKGANTGGNGAVDTGDFGTEKENVASTKSAETNLGMSNRDSAISNMYTNMPTPTVTVGVDKFGNPIEIKTTYTAKRNRQKALDALNAQGISSFDPRVAKKGFNFLNPNNLINTFAPKKSNFGIIDIGLMLASGGLFGGKIAGLAKGYNTGKFALDQIQNIAELAKNFGITDTNVAKDFVGNLTSNLTSKGKTTSKTDDDPTTRDGDGLGSTPEMAALRDEYYLLLQKLQTGSILNSERNRLTALKNLLGMA